MSRFDLEGFFWDDTEIVDGVKVERTRQLAHIPDSIWRPPEFPNLAGAKVIGLDTETYDPGLRTCGPGWARGNGHVVGISLSTADGSSWYFPIRHTVQSEYNMDPENVLRFLRDALKTDCPKVGANLQYDVGWLKEEGVIVKGPLYDIQFAEALIDDVAESYSLDSIANKYLGESKITNDLYNWSKRSYGGKKDQRGNIYRCPPTLVGPYAEADASLPIQILRHQWKELNRLGLLDLFKMECKLINILVNMRQKGICVDLDKAEYSRVLIKDKIDKLRETLKDHAGFNISVNSNKDIAKMFDADNQEYPLTNNGNPSFVKDWLNQNEYIGAKLIGKIRKYQKAEGTFIQGAIIDKAINSRVYPSFHPLRGEWGGAVSGRFSSSKPNAQQIPSRDNELAPLIRGIFVPEQGMEWIKFDYSQIEYRFFAHFSRDKKLIHEYQDPEADFHSLVGSMLNYEGDRVTLKGINFGLLYGMGKQKLISILEGAGTEMAGEEFLEMYHNRFPAARKLIRRCSNKASKDGEIRTILSRRNTFNLYEPVMGWARPLPFHQATRLYGGHIQRSSTHKALNRMLQGSSADLMKKAMVLIHEEGIFDRVGYPYVTVHDELDFGYHPDNNKEYKLIKQIMEEAIKIKVPVIVNTEKGSDWGHVKEFKL